MSDNGQTEEMIVAYHHLLTSMAKITLLGPLELQALERRIAWPSSGDDAEVAVLRDFVKGCKELP